MEFTKMELINLQGRKGNTDVDKGRVDTMGKG